MKLPEFERRLLYYLEPLPETALEQMVKYWYKDRPDGPEYQASATSKRNIRNYLRAKQASPYYDNAFSITQLIPPLPDPVPEDM